MLVIPTPCACAISALRSSNATRCTSRPAPCRRCATGIQNRVWYSASVVMRRVSEEGMQLGPRCVVAVLQYRMCRDSSSEGFLVGCSSGEHVFLLFDAGGYHNPGPG